eukprot:m.7653 g.7653  ORF g.7653 m.7653 type:complete len:452 (+) comp2784_c1_seq1:247-1602(+)
MATLQVDVSAHVGSRKREIANWAFFLLVAEVLGEDVKGTLVDLLVHVALKHLDALNAVAPHDEVCVHGAMLGALFAMAENVLEAIECNLDDLGVGRAEKLADWRDAAVMNELVDLLNGAARGSVADGPGSLLASFPAILLDDADQLRHDVALKDFVKLRWLASSNVGYRPAGLLADGFLGVGEKLLEIVECVTLEDDLGLLVVARDNVANGAESRGDDRGRLVAQKLDEAVADARINDALDLLVGAIGKVRESPACIGQNLRVALVKEADERGQGSADDGKVGRWVLATAEVGKRPGCVALEGDLLCRVEELNKRLECIRGNDHVAVARRVTSNVAKRPDGLFGDVMLGRADELDEEGNGAVVDNDLGLGAGARSNVGQSPGRLKLQFGRVGALQKLDKARHNTGLDDRVDGWVFLARQETAKLGGVLELGGSIVAPDTGKKLLEVGLILG